MANTSHFIFGEYESNQYLYLVLLENLVSSKVVHPSETHESDALVEHDYIMRNFTAERFG